MIVEALRALFMPAGSVARALGYVAETVALDSRARRQRTSWSPHLDAAHDALREAVTRVPVRGTVAILGSGLLLEIPFEELCLRFERVFLVDLVFPCSVRRRARQAGNVHLVEADITGVLDTLVRNGRCMPEVPCPAPLPSEALHADFLISANVLSQLPVLPRLHLEKRGADLSGIEAFCRSLIESHLAALSTASGCVFFLGDFEREEKRKNGLRERYDLLYGARPQLTGPRTWWWDVAPPGEEARGLRVRHRVCAGILAVSCPGSRKTPDPDPGTPDMCRDE